MIISIEQLSLEELRAFLREQADDTFPALKDEQHLNMLAEKWCKYAEFCTCRDENKQLVGIIAFYANQLGGVAYIPHVYVSPNFRGKGIFTGLLHKVLEYVKGKGYTCLRLEVESNNLRAQKAYQKNGFRIDGNATDISIYMKLESYD